MWVRGRGRGAIPRIRNPRMLINNGMESEFERITLDPISWYPIPADLVVVLKKNLEPYPGISNKSLEWLSFIQKLSYIKYIKETNYLQTLKHLLYLEGYYSEKSPNQFITTKINRAEWFLGSNHFNIQIRAKILSRHLHDSLMPNDLIEVRSVTNPKKYNLVIKYVGPNFITVEATSEFLNTYRAGLNYRVKFEISNWPIRACHYAISLVNESKLSPILYPNPREVCNQPIPVLLWFDNNIRRNAEQMQAVQRILGQTARPSPYLVFGPPGTGKTATIVEAISQVSKTLGKKILVCTPSNAAADEITKRLMFNIEDHLICRLNSQSRVRSDIDSIHCCSYYHLSKDMIRTKEIFIMTLITCTRLVRTGLFKNYFSYIFIDEAGQATQPEILIPLGLMEPFSVQLVLSGDPKQLGPVVKTKVGQHLLGESMLERLMDRVEIYQRGKDSKYNPNFLTKLVKNYRSHEAILRVPNQMFYENELMPCGSKNIFRAENWSTLPKKHFPLFFHAVHGFEKRLKGSTSSYNQSEVDIVVKYVKKLMNEGLDEDKIEETDIGIVSPFKSQGAMIKNALERKGWHEITVGTVEIFQGQEKNIIIVSTVRSAVFQHDGKYDIGFLSQEKRFNVTVTRAKSLLIVVGHPKALQFGACWLEFIKYCQENGACRGEKFVLSDLSKDAKLQMIEKKDSGTKDEGSTVEEMFKLLYLGK